MTPHVGEAGPNDARAMALLLAAVAEERDGIATEPPVDVEAQTDRFARSVDYTRVAVVGAELIGMMQVEPSSFGFGYLVMAVAKPWRGRGVGSALVAAAIERAPAWGLHKLSLDVFPHNEAAIALYRKFGFVPEGRRVKHYRRASGELWDAIVMGRLL